MYLKAQDRERENLKAEYQISFISMNIFLAKIIAISPAAVPRKVFVRFTYQMLTWGKTTPFTFFKRIIWWALNESVTEIVRSLLNHLICQSKPYLHSRYGSYVQFCECWFSRIFIFSYCNGYSISHLDHRCLVYHISPLKPSSPPKPQGKRW